MKTKIIPFDLETAKKIQAGEIEGKVMDRDNLEGIIITTEGCNTPLPVIVKFSFIHGDNILFFGKDGKNAKGNELVLEVPDIEPQFKPFDKVLVRDSDDEEWTCALFSHMTNLAQPYTCVGNLFVYQCIPYKGNEHLAGTTDNPKEE